MVGIRRDHTNTRCHQFLAKLPHPRHDSLNSTANATYYPRGSCYVPTPKAPDPAWQLTTPDALVNQSKDHRKRPPRTLQGKISDSGSHP